MSAITEAIHRQVMARPHHPAVVDAGETVTYAELWARAGAVARALRVPPGSVVAVAAERGSAFVCKALGCWLAGCAYLPLDPVQPTRRLRGMVADSGAPVVVVSGAHAGIGADLGVDEVVPGTPGPVSPAPDGPCAYVIYTSGTTGVPKGVLIGHDSLANLVDWHVREYAITPADRTLHTAGLGFDAAVWEIWPYLAAGATVVTCADDDRVVADFIVDQLAAQECTTAFVATALAEELLALRTDVPSLRVLLTGGDALCVSAPPTMRLVNHYGPTEATVVATAHVVRKDTEVGSLPPIGGPISGVTVAVLDDVLRPCDEGELFVGGRGVAIGYLNAPALTAERFVTLPGRPGRWYRTGDRVRWTDELEFLGRVDRDQLKVRGVRIAAAEVEVSILAHPGVRAACATVVGHGADSALIAVITTTGRVPEEDIQRELRTSLPPAVMPNRFVVVDRIPLTPNGKVDREAVARRAAAG